MITEKYLNIEKNKIVSIVAQSTDMLQLFFLQHKKVLNQSSNFYL